MPAWQSSVAPGRRLRGQLLGGCFEEGWGRELDSLFGVTPSSPFLLPPAQPVPSASNWKEIGGDGGRRPGWLEGDERGGESGRESERILGMQNVRGRCRGMWPVCFPFPGPPHGS